MIKLVIADDEPGIRNGLETLYPWQQLGIQIVCSVSNGQKAIDYIEQNPVHMLITDIRMPVMDGLELARQIHEHYPHIRVIMLSAYADFGYARTALRYGVSQYITKPIAYDEFVNTLSSLCASIVQYGESPLRCPQGNIGESPLRCPQGNIGESPLRCPQENRKETDDYLGYYQELIRKVKTYVGEDPAMATLIGAADRTGMSANYLSQIFRQYEEQTFSDYLTTQRMELAAALLKNQLPIEDAAWQCGYHHVRTFNQAFRNYYGSTPFVYLKQFRKED